MRILILTPFYTPDIGPSAPLFALLASALSQRGHQVTVVAAVPHYTNGRVSDAYKKKWMHHTVEAGINVIRVAVPSLNRASFRNRMLQFISFQLLATLASLFLKYDAAIITNPAIETWLPLTWHARIRRKPVIFSVFDVYPDVGIKLGVFHSPWIIKAIALLEKSCLRPASFVQIISDNFRTGLRKLGVPDEKMAYVGVWTDTELVRPLDRQNSFSLEYGLTDSFNVLYAGNLGLSQGLENALTAAEGLLDQADIRLVIVGDGSESAHLQAIARDRGLSNVYFIPFQPRDRLPEVLASADVSLVMLRRGIGLESLPSKTFTILASGRPILACVDEESELRHLIDRSRSGIWLPPEEPSRLVDAIFNLKNDPALRQRLGANGRSFIEKDHSAPAAAEKFEALLMQAIR